MSERWTGRTVMVHDCHGGGTECVIRRAWVGARTRRLLRVEVAPSDPVVSAAPSSHEVASVADEGRRDGLLTVTLRGTW